MIEIELWTDGSCNNNKKHENHGIGGWAFSTYLKGEEVPFYDDYGFAKDSSSSRMEQTAVLKGLKYLSKKYKADTIRVHIYSDSAYVVNCFKDRWFERWYEIEFLGIKNSDLWKPILDFRGNRKFKMFFNHVKGHSGIEKNERVDYLAGEARKYYIERLQGLLM